MCRLHNTQCKWVHNVHYSHLLHSPIRSFGYWSHLNNMRTKLGLLVCNDPSWSAKFVKSHTTVQKVRPLHKQGGVLGSEVFWLWIAFRLLVAGLGTLYFCRALWGKVSWSADLLHNIRANSVVPDQTAINEGAVWWGSSLFAIPSASFGHISHW